MKQHLSKFILGTELLAALLILGAVFLWAPVCTALLTLQNGSMVHMKCFYTGQTSVLLSLILLAAAIAAFLSKKDHHKIQWVIILIGILLIASTSESVIGIGICKKAEMACNATAFWIKTGGGLAIVGGLIYIFAHSTETHKSTL